VSNVEIVNVLIPASERGAKMLDRTPTSEKSSEPSMTKARHPPLACQCFLTDLVSITIEISPSVLVMDKKELAIENCDKSII
jgi:hypothetical protein